MRRYYYEKARSMQRHWLIFDRERGTPLPGLIEASKAVAVCFSQDDAERIVEALNLACQIAIDRQRENA